MSTLNDAVAKCYGLYRDTDPKIFDQTFDDDGYRIVCCRLCGRTVRVSECWTYGGLGDLINTGICYNCK